MRGGLSGRSVFGPVGAAWSSQGCQPLETSAPLRIEPRRGGMRAAMSPLRGSNARDGPRHPGADASPWLDHAAPPGLNPAARPPLGSLLRAAEGRLLGVPGRLQGVDLSAIILQDLR